MFTNVFLNKVFLMSNRFPLNLVVRILFTNVNNCKSEQSKKDFYDDWLVRI